MNTYTVFSTGKTPDFSVAPACNVDCFPWDTSGYRPVCTAKLLRGVDRFYLAFDAVEKELCTVARDIHPLVWHDSAVEFFLMPAPQVDGRYVNLEFNAVGAMYIGVGTGREDSALLKDEDLFQFHVKTTIEHLPSGYHWTLTAEIPFAFLARYTAFSDAPAGYEMRANFYKLAEKSTQPYYACWNPIVAPAPDFHLPAYFGTLLCR